jgi:hypothetical protein
MREAWPVAAFSTPIAVGTPVAGCPPHRPGRAGLPHPVPTLGFGVEALLLPAPGRAHWSRFPGSASGACFALPGSPWLHPFPPLRPPPLPRFCSGASPVLRVYVTSRARSSRDCGLGLSLTACSRSCCRRPRDLSVLARGVVRVHAHVLRPRQIRPALAISIRSMLPSAWIHGVGIWERCFRGSITHACTPPANASAWPHGFTA